METPATDGAHHSISVDLVKFAPALNDLAEKQQRYVLARVRGFNIRQSAKLAGYTDIDSAGYHLEKHPRIRLVLDAMTKAASNELQLERKDVLDGLMDAVRMAATSTELAGAWREIAKVIGAYEPIKVEHSHRNVTMEKLAAMSDADLAALADDPNYAVIEGEFAPVPKVPTTDEAQDAPSTDDPKRYGDAPLEAAPAELLGEQGMEAVLAAVAYEDDEKDTA